MKYALAFLLAVSKSILASSLLSTEDCNFGDAYAFNKAHCMVTFRNASDSIIHIGKFASQAQHDNDRIVPDTLTLAPHSVAYATAIVNTGNDIGLSRHVFTFSTDDNDQVRAFAARGFVQNILDDGRSILNFGVVDLGSDLPARSIGFQSLEDPSLRVTKIKEVPQYIKATLEDGGKSLRVALRANASWGYQGEFIKLETNSSLQRELWIGVQADVHGDIVPAMNPYSLGLLRSGSRNEIKIPIRSGSQKSFQTGKITLDGLMGTANITACIPADESCRELVLRISDEQPRGSIVGKVKITFPDRNQELNIAINGLIVDKDAKIEKLEAGAIENGQPPKSSVAREATTDLSRALEQATANALDDIPSGNGPLLKWAAANEAALHGYQIYRANGEKGPFKVINPQSIPIKTRDNTGSKYAFRDNSAQTGNTYWYFIGLLYNDGHKQQLTGPQEVVAK